MSLGYSKSAIVGLLLTKCENLWVMVPYHGGGPRLRRGGRQSTTARRHGHESRDGSGQVGYFLSPLDLIKECLTFFRFKAAFKRLVFFRLFMFSSMDQSLSSSVTKSLTPPAAP